MRFVLRCSFWLSIVYASILSPHQARQVHEAAVGVGAHIASAREVAGGAALCAGRHAIDCVDDAARLTALLARVTENVDQAYAGGSSSGRRGPGERLARAP